MTILAPLHLPPGVTSLTVKCSVLFTLLPMNRGSQGPPLFEDRQEETDAVLATQRINSDCQQIMFLSI